VTPPVVSFDQVVTMTDAFLASVALLESKIVGVNQLCLLVENFSLQFVFGEVIYTMTDAFTGIIRSCVR
jgi:hypothetical protein